MKKINKKYHILKDNQEKIGSWIFSEDEYCSGMTVTHLPTGDYTIKGLENIVIIERKRSTGELAKNITEKRFEKELQRMDLFKHSFLILEFSLDDIFRFPYGSSIPPKFWPKLKVGSNYILKRLIEIQTSHKCQVVFTNGKGKQIAQLIFKRMVELYGREVNKED